MSIFDDALAQLGSSVVRSVTIESALGSFTLDDPLHAPPPPAGGSAPFSYGQLAVNVLRPKITIELGAGAPIVIAPAGDPPAVPYLGLALVAVLALAVYGAYRLAT